MIFSAFPDVLWWGGFLIPVILRAGLVVVLTSLAIVHLGRGGALERSVGVFEGALVILIALGLFTQVAALAVFLFSLAALFLKEAAKNVFPRDKSFYFLLALISLSLFLVGAGPFAFDVPL